MKIVATYLNDDGKSFREVDLSDAFEIVFGEGVEQIAITARSEIDVRAVNAHVAVEPRSANSVVIKAKLR